MVIRAASKLDVAAVVACANMAFATELECADCAGPESDAQLEAQVLAGAMTVFRRQGKVLGYISLCSTADHLFVDFLAVLPDCHGQGVGSLLLLFAEHEAARRGLGSVRLFTTETMAGNQGFYERRGYLETDRSNDDGFARVFYRKDVAPELPPGTAHVDTLTSWLRLWSAPQNRALTGRLRP